MTSLLSLGFGLQLRVQPLPVGEPRACKRKATNAKDRLSFWSGLRVVSVVAHQDRALRSRERDAIEVGDMDSDRLADLSQRRFQSLFERRMIYWKFKHPRCGLAAPDSPCEQMRDVNHSWTEEHGSGYRAALAIRVDPDEP
jgi:hypothetical protein